MAQAGRDIPPYLAGRRGASVALWMPRSPPSPSGSRWRPEMQVDPSVIGFIVAILVAVAVFAGAVSASLIIEAAKDGNDTGPFL